MPRAKKYCDITPENTDADIYAELVKDAGGKGMVCKKVLGEGGVGKAYKFEIKNTRVVKLSALDETYPAEARSIIKTQKIIANKFQNSCETHGIMCHYSSYHTYNSKNRTLYEYLVTNYIDGGDLFDKRMYTAKRLFDVIKQYISAVAYMHSQGVIHYDLKPENVMVDKKGKLYIIDFGYAELISSRRVRKPRGYTPGFQPTDTKEYSNTMPVRVGRYFDYYALARSFYNTAGLSEFVLTGRVSKKDLAKIEAIRDYFLDINEDNFDENISEVYRIAATK